MKLSKIPYTIFLFAVALLAPLQSALAQEHVDNDLVRELNHEIDTPEIPDRQHDYIKSYMYRIALELYNQKFNVETKRKGAVVIATLPSDDLFMPNEAELYDAGKDLLDKFRQYIDNDKLYKVLITVHSDDTGSDGYLLALTQNRVNAIFDYYQSKGANVNNIIGFPMSNINPLNDNETRKERAENRRVEIYIVPAAGLVEQAKTSGKK